MTIEEHNRRLPLMRSLSEIVFFVSLTGLLSCSEKDRQGDARRISGDRVGGSESPLLSAPSERSSVNQSEDPDSAVKSWDQIQLEARGGALQQEQEARLIEQMVAGGRFADALALIRDRTGNDRKREVLIFSLFSKNGEPLEKQFEKINHEFKDEKEKWAALRGVSRNLSSPDGFSKLEAYLASGMVPSDDEAVAIAGGVGAFLSPHEVGMQYYQDPSVESTEPSSAVLNERFQKAEHALELLLTTSGETRSGAVRQFLDFAATIDPVRAWSTFNRFREHLGSEEESTRNRILLDMIRRDPAGGVNLMLAEDSGGLREGDLGAALQRWIAQDSKASEDWIALNRDRLPASQQQELISAESGALAATGDFAAARHTASKLPNSPARENALQTINDLERKEVRSVASSQPLNLVEGIVSGDSKFETRWLEEGMITWVRKDIESAEAWYRANLNRLDPGSEQYIAAAFARDALGKGELEIARQWIGRVSDPVTLNRLQGYLHKAEGTGGE